MPKRKKKSVAPGNKKGKRSEFVDPMKHQPVRSATFIKPVGRSAARPSGHTAKKK